MSLVRIGVSTCDGCGWHEEFAPRVWRWEGGEVTVGGFVLTDPCLCVGCLRRNGLEPPPRDKERHEDQ